MAGHDYSTRTCWQCYVHGKVCVPGATPDRPCKRCAKHSKSYCNIGGRVPCYGQELYGGLYIATLRQSFARYFEEHGPDVWVPPISANPADLFRAWEGQFGHKLAELRHEHYLDRYRPEDARDHQGWQVNFQGDSWQQVPDIIIARRH